MATQSFTYTGAEETWVVPADVYSISVDMAGGEGGDVGSAATSPGVPGRGGRVTANLSVTPGETLRVRVGRRGLQGANGVTGPLSGVFYGPSGDAGASSNGAAAQGGTGGGASDIRQGGTTDAFRVLVAGGGGGCQNNLGDNGGAGGHALDTESTTPSAAAAGQAGTNGGAGGGAGWRGGWGGNVGSGVQSGGGTSMAHSTATSGASSTPNFRAGDGYVTFTYYPEGTGTTTQNLYLHTDDQDFTAPGEGDIRKTSDAATPTATVVAQHPNSAGTTDITIDPYTNRSTQGDFTDDYGWAVNRNGPDGMESVENARRFIPAGNWVFHMNVAVPNAALLGTLTASFVAYVYRVSSTGTRTLLFQSNRSSTIATTAGLANDGTCSATAPGQPEIILEPDETIHIGWLVRCVQASGALGATVAGNITWTTGGSGRAVTPAPGIRTTFDRTPAAEEAPCAEAGEPLRVFTGFRSTVSGAPVADVHERAFVGTRAVADSAPAPDITARRTTQYRRPDPEQAPASCEPARRFTGARSLPDESPAADAPSRQFAGTRATAESAAAADECDRQVDFGRAPSASFAPAAETTERIYTAVRDTPEQAASQTYIDRHFVGARSTVDDAPSDDVQARVITYGRNLTEGPADIVPYPGFKELVGVVYDPDGNPFEGAEVWLIRLSDDKHIRTTTSGVNGVWQFDRDLFDVQSYLIYGFTTDPSNGSIQWADVSDRGVTVVDTGSVTPGDDLNGVDPNIYLGPQEVHGSGGGVTVVRKIINIFED